MVNAAKSFDDCRNMQLPECWVVLEKLPIPTDYNGTDSNADQLDIPEHVAQAGAERQTVYKYEAPWPVYSMNWSVRSDKPYRLAVGSFIEKDNNTVQIISLDEDTNEFSVKSMFNHPYATTKIMWIPDTSGTLLDLLATSGDFLRVWRPCNSGTTQLECVLNNNSIGDYCGPVSSFDWNEVDPSLIGTSSIDRACTIWDIVCGRIKTQVIAHHSEVYDIAFSRAGNGRNMFASVGGDGCVLMFDMRNMNHSTVLYEDPTRRPLVRLALNKQDPNYLATVAINSCEVLVLDIRNPCTPVARLNSHQGYVNGIVWSPTSSSQICTAGDDQQALLWDIKDLSQLIQEPILAYADVEGEINQIQWGATQPDRIAICYKSTCEILRI